MIEELEKLLKQNIKNINSNDLVYASYLCDKLVGKYCKLYVKNELEEDDELEKAFLTQEFQDLINNEHINDCNILY